MAAPLKCFHVPPWHSCYFSGAFSRLSPETPDTPGKADSHEKYLPALPGSGGIPAIPPDGLFSHMCQRLFRASRAAAARWKRACLGTATTGTQPDSRDHPGTSGPTINPNGQHVTRHPKAPERRARHEEVGPPDGADQSSLGSPGQRASHHHRWLKAPNLNGKRQSGRVETKWNHPHGHEIRIGPDPQAAPAQDRLINRRIRGAEDTLLRNAASPSAGRQLQIFIYPALAHGSFVLSSRIPSDRENLGTYLSLV